MKIQTWPSRVKPPDPHRNEYYDGRFESAHGGVIVEVKGTSTTRDLRDALLALVYALDIGSRADAPIPPAAHAVLVLINTRLSSARLQAELEHFRAVVRNDLGSRVFAVELEEDGRLQGELPHPHDPKLAQFIRELAHQEASGAEPHQRVSHKRVSRQAVKSLLLESFVRHVIEGLNRPASVVELQCATGASYPTVASAVKDLDAEHALASTASKGRAPGGIELLTPGPDTWRRIAEGHAGERRTLRYTDPTGQPMRPERLLQRLENIRRQHLDRHRRDLALDLAVGGVLGAKMLYPELDLKGRRAWTCACLQTLHSSSTTSSASSTQAWPRPTTPRPRPLWSSTRPGTSRRR